MNRILIFCLCILDLEGLKTPRSYSLDMTSLSKLILLRKKYESLGIYNKVGKNAGTFWIPPSNASGECKNGTLNSPMST